MTHDVSFLMILSTNCQVILISKITKLFIFELYCWPILREKYYPWKYSTNNSLNRSFLSNIQKPT